jgi:hypothetical protein
LRERDRERIQGRRSGNGKSEIVVFFIDVGAIHHRRIGGREHQGKVTSQGLSEDIQRDGVDIDVDSGRVIQGKAALCKKKGLDWSERNIPPQYKAKRG